MRISDWSSDVCSSDLGSASFSGAKVVCMRLPQETAGLENTSGIERAAYPGLQGRDLWVAGILRWHGSPYRLGARTSIACPPAVSAAARIVSTSPSNANQISPPPQSSVHWAPSGSSLARMSGALAGGTCRSEEHTSELQS